MNVGQLFGRALSIVVLLAVQVAPLTPANAAPGDLDTAFGGDGTVTTAPVPRGGAAHAVAIQSDGKIVAAGETLGAKGKFATVRYKRNGTLDREFGRDGKVTTNFSGGSDFVDAVAIQTDGRIVVAGGSGVGGANPRFAVVRYLPDGTLDPGFGGDGKVMTDFTGGFDAAYDVAIQPDGKIVAAGVAGGGEAVAMVRYSLDGSLDPSFAGDGTVATDLTDGFDGAVAIAIQSDGRIVLAGFASGSLLARYNSDGTLDATFGSDGIVLPCCGSFGVSDIVLQPDGKIVTAGEHFECFGAGDCDRTMVLTRTNTDGTLDTSFDEDGISFAICGSGFSVAAQADGKIVAAGIVYCGVRKVDEFGLVRLAADGSLDRSFGQRGTVSAKFNGHKGVAAAVAIQPDGRIIAAGSANLAGGARFALARFLGSLGRRPTRPSLEAFSLGRAGAMG